MNDELKEALKDIQIIQKNRTDELEDLRNKVENLTAFNQSLIEQDIELKEENQDQQEKIADLIRQKDIVTTHMKYADTLLANYRHQMDEMRLKALDRPVYQQPVARTTKSKNLLKWPMITVTTVALIAVAFSFLSYFNFKKIEDNYEDVLVAAHKEILEKQNDIQQLSDITEKTFKNLVECVDDLSKCEEANKQKKKLFPNQPKEERNMPTPSRSQNIKKKWVKILKDNDPIAGLLDKD